jgi:hypothetical protein
LFSVAIISVIRTFLLQFGYRECLEFVFGWIVPVTIFLCHLFLLQGVKCGNVNQREI